MKKANFIVFDCETGGFSHVKNPINEMALVAIDGETLKEIERFETYIKPYDNLVIEKKALAVTGLKMIDINAGLDKKVVVKSLISFFKKVSPNNHPQSRPILVGHNVQFDVGFTKSLFERCNKNLFDFVSPTSSCTMLRFKEMYPRATSLKLGNCCKTLGIELSEAHRAMPDTLATVDLFKALVLKGRNSEVSVNKNVNSGSNKQRNKFQY